MRTWTTLTTWAVAAAVLVAAVNPTQAQARERRPLYRPRKEVAAVAEAEPSVPDGSDSINTLHTITSSQLSSNDSYRGSGDGSNSTTNADSYEVSRPSPGNENAGAGVTGRQHGGGNRQHGGGRRQQGGGGGGRQQGGGGGGRQQGGGGGGRQQSGGGGGGRQHEGTYSNVATGDRISTGSLPESDISRHQMDTTILLLQRLSDRLTATETLQNQRAERIDTINYRLTRIELQAEERKSVISELSNSLRHRMETTDNELDTIVTHLDEIKSSIRSLSQQHNEFKATISEIPKEQGAESGQSLGLKLQAVTATINGLRSAMQAVKDDISQIGQNLTVLTNVSQNLGQLSQNIVTKQYMHQSLNEIRNKDTSPSMSLLAQLMGQSRAPRRGSGNQGKVSTEPEDCWKLMNQGKNKSGVYRIRPSYATAPFFVYCDMETDGGGWTVIQRREDGSVDFLREWADYKYGFGNLAGEFWLGNEKIHLLTNQHVSKLRVELADFDQQSGHAVYSAFAIGSELEGYSLKMLGQYSGDAGDSLRYHVGRRFSTTDVDNDAWPEKSCARDHKGAWWYRACETSNLNGRYLHGPVPADHQYTGLYWYDFRGPQYSLWKSSMMIRRGGSVGDPVFKAFKEVKKQATTERISSNDQQDKITTTSPDNFNPDHDPYAIYEYPTYS
ncbi:fibrinogen C domain-containing protein 1 isoform X1 [Procambarus clarkii]|uniref:fibrinogen C domain-containing protein 1 isoform X1 n=1 Tax=Procambarus clarkii TaxID=6728 RepID=UPI0037439866